MAIAIHRHAHARSCSRHLANDMASDSFSALSSVGQSSINPASPDSTTNSCSIACAVNAVALRASAGELAFEGSHLWGGVPAVAPRRSPPSPLPAVQTETGRRQGS